MKNVILLITRVLAIVVVAALYILGFKYGYGRIEIKYFIILAIIGAAFLLVVLFVLLAFVEGFKNSITGVKKQPFLYDEVKSTLRDILLPLDFEEHEQSISWIKTIEFSRGKYLVRLGVHIADGEYVFVTKSKQSKVKGDKEIFDLSVNGDKAFPEVFKTQVTKELNEWLTKKKIS